MIELQEKFHPPKKSLTFFKTRKMWLSPAIGVPAQRAEKREVGKPNNKQPAHRLRCCETAMEVGVSGCFRK